MNILVTGGAGFIGYHLCSSLLKKGHALTVVDSFHPYYEPALKQARVEALQQSGTFSFFRQDILDEENMHALFEREQPEAVIHLAAVPGVRGSLHEPITYVDIDVKGTVHMLELSKQYGVKRFLFASSSSVYGERSINQPLQEDSVNLSVASPYAASKLAAEVFCRTYTQLYDISITSLRFFTVYGPHQRPDMAISRFLKRLLDNQPLPLYNTSSVRDYTYVDDIVNGIEAALRRMGGYQVYNLGSGKPVGLMELVHTLESVTGIKANLIVEGAQPGDVSGTWADITAAREELGWTPQVTLEEGLHRYYQWWQSR
ncbi:NAD-dependent epimerase/dehydratase family protein [Brevibacillus sp. H7]|uniref:NAD-dependent epimerase/dehydratase family protein n=1 Tax=Brevibacillus sp. H7 TaxID=3349138 RepID=UPI0037FABEE9